MKSLPYFFLMFFCVTIMIAQQSENKNESGNPFFSEYKTPFQTPPFDLIKPEHFKPAYMKGMEEERNQVDAIVNNSEPASFNNTILALERNG
ncbi:MAG: peptidase M3, partial [Bacteroidetes bacterium]|nr:peptidase M3 [Bacteroidota bacterium]